MDEINFTNTLRIVEDEMPLTIISSSDNDSNDDNESNGEVFDFSAVEIEELEGRTSESSDETATESKQKKRNSLLIIEDDKDLIMESSGDFNNNCNNNIHRLSLQIESGDSESLVMTNEAVNRTIIQIGSRNGIDFGESNDNIDVDAHEQHELSDQDESDSEADNAIVNILGQIDEIVSVCGK